MGEIEEIRKEADLLFEIYKRLEAKRISEYQVGDEPLRIEARKAEDHFLLYIALHLLVHGEWEAYRGRRMRLLERARH